MSSAQPSNPPPPSKDASQGPSYKRPPIPRASARTSDPGQSGPSWVEWLATVMKLGAAVCGLAAAGLFIRPLVKDEVKAGPRLITLQPMTPPPPVSPEAPTGPRDAAPTMPVDAPVPPVVATPPSPQPGKEQVQENRTSFKGALLSLESEPSGATVRMNGINQGDTPITVGLDCTPGTTISITLSLRGYESLTHRTACPRDALVKVTAQLHKGTGKTPPTKSPGKGPGKSSGKR